MHDNILQCNIFNPLITIDCKEHHWPTYDFSPHFHFVVFCNKLYYGGVGYDIGDFGGKNGILWSFTPDLRSHSLSNVPSICYGLTTYKSQLVLVGGRSLVSCKPWNKVWTSDDGCNWAEGAIPPLLTHRNMPLAVNFGDPECLLVSGGQSKRPLQVEVLKEAQWWIVEPLPSCLSPPRHFTLHIGTLYLCRESSVICCNLDALLTTCTHHKDTVKPSGLWRTLSMPFGVSLLMSFKEHLLAFCPDCKMFAYSPYKQSWIHVGNLQSLQENLISCGGFGDFTTNNLFALRNNFSFLYKISPRGSYSASIRT